MPRDANTADARGRTRRAVKYIEPQTEGNLLARKEHVEELRKQVNDLTRRIENMRVEAICNEDETITITVII